MLKVLPPLSNEYEHPVFQMKLHMIIPPQYSFVYSTPLSPPPSVQLCLQDKTLNISGYCKHMITLNN